MKQKQEIASVLGIAPERLRVLSYDVGGNFGSKNRPYVEFGLVLWASHKLGRPVKYTATRSEAFLSDYQGRDLVTEVELALRKDGRFLAMRAYNISNVGAHCVSLSPLGKGSALITGSYDIPVATLRSRAVFTNTMPTNAYRSSGRPEVTFAIERLIDTAATEMGIDRIELRRRNLIAPQAMPYTNAVGMPYDSGTYEANMDLAMRNRRLGRLRGTPQAGGKARQAAWLGTCALCRILDRLAEGARRDHGASPNGRVSVVIGTQPSGQGHETSFAQVVADLLAVPVEAIDIIIGDTDIVSVGGGSHSGRSMRHAATVIAKAAPDMIAHGKQIAALLLQTTADKIEFTDGRFASPHSNRTFDLLDLAKEAARIALPAELKDGLAVAADNEMHDPVFPNGCAVCEVEIDPDTGGVDDHALRGGRRRRPLHQSDDRRRPDAWRHRAGRRPGDVGTVHDRSRAPASRSAARSWITACRARTRCRRSRPRSSRCCRRPIRSASRPAAKAAPRRRSRSSSTPSSMR